MGDNIALLVLCIHTHVADLHARGGTAADRGHRGVGLDGFHSLMLDGKVIHEHTLGAIPHITAVCTVDKENDLLITKLVNFSENEVNVRITTDVAMQETAEITTLTADSYYAKNTFENKEAVVPYTEKIAASSDCTIVIKPRSVNVIRHALKK